MFWYIYSLNQSFVYLLYRNAYAVIYTDYTYSIVLILDSNSEHFALACRKKANLFGEKNPICYWSRSKQMP